ncbi:hypothetical protein SAMN02745866_03846 [Alteromonadaceae bacterium Bs31]|nr:hypothetical protein SAMN02745866_03846 [Alteromonadaceae bacterium Bs31]
MLGFYKKKAGRRRKIYFGPIKVFEYRKPRKDKEKKDLRLQASLEKNYCKRDAGEIKPGDGAGLIVSLTTFGHRATRVHVVLESIFQQSLLPKKVVLWLDEAEFSQSTLPEPLQKAKSLGVEIAFCKNIRSYKKIIPTLRKYPDETIVTIDDDVMYPVDFLEKLAFYHKQHPDLILCYRAHRISFGENRSVLPYAAWESRIHNVEPSATVFPTGSGGVLYPAGCFVDEVMDESVFMDICPTADDIWLKAMSLKNGVNSWVVPGENEWSDVPPYIDDTQEECLAEVNIEQKNDVQLQAVFDRFGLWSRLFEAEESTAVGPSEN